MPHTIILHAGNRQHAARVLGQAPNGYVMTIAEPKRTLDQNALMWALITEISKAKLLGIRKTPDDWKALLMHAAGSECQFETGLDGRPFPVGFRTSKLTKSQMSNLIEWIYAFCAEHGLDVSKVAPKGMEE